MKTIQISTGVRGLDQILGGGLRLPAGDQARSPTGSILIRGGAGSGKTLLAAVLATRAAAAAGGKSCVLFGLVEQAPDDVALFLGQFRALNAQFLTAHTPAADEEQETSPICFLESFDPLPFTIENAVSASSAIRDQLEAWLSAARKRGFAPVACVLDGLMRGSPLVEHFDRLTFQDLARFGTDHGLIMVIIEEEGAGPDWLPYASDIVVRLLAAPIEPAAEAPLRRLVIEKARFSGFVEGSHPYEIHASPGFTVYPALHSYVDRRPTNWRHRSTEREPFGLDSLDQACDGKTLLPQSLTLLHGQLDFHVEAVAQRYLAYLDDDKEFNIDLAMHPRSIVAASINGPTTRSGRRTQPLRTLLGDFGIPPEKLCALFFELTERWESETNRKLNRVRIGNLFVLETFPALAFERLLQCIQLIARHLARSSVSVLLTASPHVPREAGFAEHQTIHLSGRFPTKLQFSSILLQRPIERTISEDEMELQSAILQSD